MHFVFYKQHKAAHRKSLVYIQAQIEHAVHNIGWTSRVSTAFLLKYFSTQAAASTPQRVRTDHERL